MTAFLTIVISVGVSNTSAATTTCAPLDPETCTLRELATHLGIRFGSTLEDFEIADSDYVGKLGSEFNAVTPENSLKLYAIQPTQGVWNFAAPDAIMATAESNGLEVRGHTLVWSQDSRTPVWVKALSDPDELWTATSDHIGQVLTRYGDRIDRWDVVNEPLETLGTGRSSSVFWSMGDDWIKRVFDLAHSMDPEAELWINEYGTDWVSGKHQAYLALVKSLVDAGTPIDGVGIQTHRLPNLPLDRRLFERQLRDFTALGLKVAITELDVPVSPDQTNAFAWQATEYSKVVEACLAVAGCTEITVWGLSDRDTWLDGLGLFAVPTRPLLFDDSLQPKPAYDAVREAMSKAVRSRALPSTGEATVEAVTVSLFVVVIGSLVLFHRRHAKVTLRRKA